MARWFTFEQPELRELVPLALDTVFEVMTTDFWSRAMAADTRLVEVPFGVRSSDGETLVFGIVDLALGDNEGWQLVDYKTDHLKVADLIAEYGGQIEEYATHWADISGERVRYAGLFGVREGELSVDIQRHRVQE